MARQRSIMADRGTRPRGGRDTTLRRLSLLAQVVVPACIGVVSALQVSTTLLVGDAFTMRTAIQAGLAVFAVPATVGAWNRLRRHEANGDATGRARRR